MASDTKKTNTPEVSTPSTIWDKHDQLIAWLIVALTALCGFLLFNMRIDEGGDDSTYICRAIDLLDSGRYPNYQGPLYPMFLAAVMTMVGKGLFALKMTSLVLLTASQAIFFYALRRRINTKLLLGLMALMSVNSWVLYYASQTYSEALFVVVEYLFLGALLRFEEREEDNWWRTAVGSLPTAATIVAAFLVRTVGGMLGIVALAYLMIRKQWLKAATMLCTWLVLTGAWYGVRTAVWGSAADGGSVQLESLLQKHPYQKDEGQETLSGFGQRLVENSKLYLSKNMMKMAGLKDADSRETNTTTTIVLVVLFGIGMVAAMRRNRVVMLMALTCAGMMGSTFIILQTLWDQYRLIVPYLAMAYAVVLYGIYVVAQKVTKAHAAKVVVGIAVLSGMLTAGQTYRKIDIDTLSKNLGDDPLYGYSTDWYNYLSMCVYVARELPEESYVACRKPNMARLYANGKKFYGIYRYDTDDADVLIDQLREKGVTHMIIASLRRDPQNPGDGVINTLHYYLSYVMKKYPGAFKMQVSVGAMPGRENEIYNDERYEPAYLLSIDYDYVDAVRRQSQKQ